MLKLSFIERLMKISRYVFVLCFLFNSNILHSQIKNDSIDVPAWGGFFNIGMQWSQVKKNVAEVEGFPNKFIGITLELGVFRDSYLAGFKYGGICPEDKKPFTNMTTKGLLTSRVCLEQFSLYAGLVSPKLIMSQKLKIFLFGTLSAGNMWVFCEERFINDCSDCDVEELFVNGGIYVNPEIYFVYGIISVGIGYHHFFNGDYINKTELKLSIIYYE